MNYGDLLIFDDNFRKLVCHAIKSYKNKVFRTANIRNFEEFCEYKGMANGLSYALEFLDLAHKGTFSPDELTKEQTNELLAADFSFPPMHTLERKNVNG